MKIINEVEADEYGGAPLKNHVKIIIAERPTASEASIFESITIIQDNCLAIRNFRQTDNRQALKGGPTTLIAMAPEQIYSMLGEEGENFAKVTTSIYQADTQSLLEAIRNPEETEILYKTKTEQGTPIKNKDTVVLQECILFYSKTIRHKLRTNCKLIPIERADMAGMYLQRMYPANATEVTVIVHETIDMEK